MPSPFPGMDPFLENQVLFPGFHDRFTTYLSEHLQMRLPVPYYADIGDRVWVEVSQRLIGPDVDVLKRNGAVDLGDTSGGVGLAAPPRSQSVVVRVPHDERHEPFVEIYSRLDQDERLVATIEVLSLSNKTPGEQGRDLYLRKQREVLGSRAHLVEIDLLRGGHHTTAVPRDLALAEAGPFDYHACVHRYDRWEEYQVYPVRLEEKLPALTIPLLPGDGEVPLDLQAVFERTYDAGPYRRRVRYEDPSLIVPSMAGDKMAWVMERVQAARLTE